METIKSQNYGSFDVAKIVAAFLVVAVHCLPSNREATLTSFIIYNALGRIAVPFFFTAAGYFLAGKDIEDLEVIKKYIKRLIELYLIWSLLYLPANIYMWLQSENIILGIMGYFRDVFFLGSFVPFWYFPALIFGVMAVHLLLKRYDCKIVLLLALVLYIVGLFGDAYYGFLSVTPRLKSIFDGYLYFFETTRNGFFFGFAFVALGVYIRKTYKNMDIKKSSLGLLLSIIALLCEAYLIKLTGGALDYNLYFSNLAVIYFLILTLQGISLPKHKIYKSLRELSILIFGFHCAVRGLLFFLATYFNMKLLVDSYWIHFVGTSILSFIISFVVLHLNNENKASWFKKLY